MSGTMDDFKNIVCNKYPNKRQEIVSAFESANINDEHKGFFGMFFIERLKSVLPLSSNRIWAWYLGKQKKKKIDERDSIADFIDLYNSNNGDSFKIELLRETPDCICQNQKGRIWAIELAMITRDEITYDRSCASDIGQIIQLIQDRINRKDGSATYKDGNKNKENVLLLEIQPIIDGPDLDKLKKSSFVFPNRVIHRCFIVANLLCGEKILEEIGAAEEGVKM